MKSVCTWYVVGALSAMLWCFADYIPELWDMPPCDQCWHERFFGLVRPERSFKPHARVIQRFAASGPKVKPALRKVTLELSPDEYYQTPAAHAKCYYQKFLEIK